MKSSDARLALADLRSTGGSTGATPGGATDATAGDSTGVTVGELGGSTVSMKGVECSSLSLGTGCTVMMEVKAAF